MTDRPAVLRLAEDYMMIGRQFYQNNGLTRTNAETILRAEAYSVATVIVGGGVEAYSFFDTALQQAINDITEMKAKANGRDRHAASETDRDNRTAPKPKRAAHAVGHAEQGARVRRKRRSP